MLRDLDNRDEVVRASERLLRIAEVRDRLPTPVEDLIAAAGLHRGGDDLFADATIDEAPPHLRRAIRALRGKVHAVLDRRRRKVYVDPSITHLARRDFRALHEVGHDILPSQNAPAHADDESTLSWLTKIEWERDANQAAAELIFQRAHFSRLAREYEIGLETVTYLSQRFGASLQAGLRRYAEFHSAPMVGLALAPSPRTREPEVYRRYEATCSPSWEARFGRPDRWPLHLDAAVFAFLGGAARASYQPLVERECSWPDTDSRPVAVRAEIVSTGYRLLVLLWQPQREFLKRRGEITLRPAA